MKSATQTIEDKVRTAIRKSNLSLGEVSRRSGVGRQNLARFMNKGVGITTKNVERLASAIECEVVLKRQTIAVPSGAATQL